MVDFLMINCDRVRSFFGINGHPDLPPGGDIWSFSDLISIKNLKLLAGA